MKIAIIAGGKGTRLGSQELPKPMVQIAGKPILEYQIEIAKKYCLNDIFIFSGYNADKIVNYFGNGKKWGVNISHIIEEVPMGTSGAIKQNEHIFNDRFMVLYGDTIFDIDLKRMIEFDSLRKPVGTLLVHPNDHPDDSDLVEIDSQFNIVQFHSKPHPEGKYFRNLVNAALYILSPEIFKYIPSNQKSDFGKDIFPVILQNAGSLNAYPTSEYIKDMGTPERLKKVSDDLISGKIARLNVGNKRKAIFLDRDGVINEEKGNLFRIDDFVLIPGVTEAIKKINQSEYLAIIVTNQPVIAKGFCSEKELRKIHDKMEYQLGQQGAFIDAIYYCPHHPERGFANEIPSLKFNCECRKPKTGMITSAKTDLNIDLTGSFIIGDSTTDIQTGINAGLNTILVRSGYGGSDGKYLAEANLVFESLLQAVDHILTNSINEQ